MTKTLFVTGSSSGIGKATVLRLHESGWNVIASMRTPEKASWVPKSDRFITPVLDVTDPESIRRVIGESVVRFGRIDAVVNNAGYGLVGPFEASTSEQVERQFSTNVLGLMNVVREVVPHMREKGGGTILNVASVGGRITFPLYSVYHATKWAVEGFSESLQFELRQFNIHIKIVEPGPIRTEFYDRSMDVIHREGLTVYDAFVERAMANMQRSGETAPGPELVAKVIQRALTDGSRKLRYSANSLQLLVLRRLLPDALFNAIVRSVVLR